MKLPLILSIFLVLLSMGYKAYYKDKPPAQREVFSWAFILILLSILNNIEATESISNLFLYIIIAIIVLNDGYEIASQL